MMLITEVVHVGEVHKQVNAGFLKMLNSLDIGEIIFRAESTHVDSILDAMYAKEFKISTIRFNAYYNPRKFNWLKRLTGGVRELLNSVRIGKKLDVVDFFWTCLFPTDHLFLVIGERLKPSKRKHIVVLHGELEYLKASKTSFKGLLGVILKIAFWLSPDNISYIVLGSNIKENLKKFVSKNTSLRINSILHPYQYDFKPLESKKTIDNKLFGAIGTQSLVKNSQLIYGLAAMFETNINDNKIVFKTVGFVLPELKIYDNGYVLHEQSYGFVESDLFERKIAELDFVLFFYQNNSYELCASGAVFEAIRIGIPIISISNSYFEYIFSNYGKMGYLCQDLQEMYSVIKNINEGIADEELKIIRKNIDMFKEHNDLNILKKELERILLL